MEKFVCVRMVQGNGMDLSLFQFDYDMSFAVFFLNADHTIYGRYGTRSKRPKEAHTDISLDGLAEAMRASLALHRSYPKNADGLKGKTGPKPRFAVPENIPALRGKFDSKLATGDQKTIARSCIHCHQIRDAERSSYFADGKPLPVELMYPWPMPEVIGLTLDRAKRATIVSVTPGSPAARAGLQAGDELTHLDLQPPVSIADVQWVLHNTAEEATLPIGVRRNGKSSLREIKLPRGWREKSDISWRTSSWALRRIAGGGLVLEDLAPAERRRRGIKDDRMALLVTHVGQYNEHAAAKRAGFQKNDLIVSYDRQTAPWSETEFFAYVLNNKKAGTRVPVTVMRGEKRIELTLPVQN